MLEKIKRNIFITMALAAAIYLLFSIYTDIDKIHDAFSVFNWMIIPVLLLLIFANYLIRFVKWHYYLKTIGIELAARNSFIVFMSGLIMSVTPGKMGELLKSYLVRQVTGEPIAKTAPVVFAERITDFIALVLLAILGAWTFNYGRIIVIGTGVFFLVVILIICSRTITESIIRRMSKLEVLRKYTEKMLTAYESTYVLLRPRPLLYMSAVSIVSWSFECLAYYLIVINFQTDVTYFFASFIYAFSTIAGAVSMLPGGLGVTDGSMTYLLVHNGIKSNIAVSATFVARIVTLWFAVIIGIVSITVYQKWFGAIKEDDKAETV